MLLSMYTSEQMRKFKDYSDVHYVLGLLDENTNTIIVPPKCPTCGSYVYIDYDLGLGQCSHCNHVSKVYISNTLNLRRDWRCL